MTSQIIMNFIINMMIIIVVIISLLGCLIDICIINEYVVHQLIIECNTTVPNSTK